MVLIYIVLAIIAVTIYYYLKAGEKVHPSGDSSRGAVSSSITGKGPTTRTSRRNSCKKLIEFQPIQKKEVVAVPVPTAPALPEALPPVVQAPSVQPEADVKTAEMLNDEATVGVVTAQLISEGGETKDVKTATGIPDGEQSSAAASSLPTITTSQTVSAPSETPADGKPVGEAKKKKKKNKGKNKAANKGTKDKSKKASIQSTDGAQ